jgi:hypothetical protein
MKAQDDFSKEEILIKVSEGAKIPGYTIVTKGVDAAGKYNEIKTPNGNIEKVYSMGLKDIERFFIDRYNKLHNYRREGDNIVLYYNIDTGEIVVIAVMAGDNLAKYPFNMKEEFIVKEEDLQCPYIAERKGIVPITKENLDSLKQIGLLSDQTAYVLFFNRNNVGFYL